jgi:predicted nucleic acid-binding protein
MSARRRTFLDTNVLVYLLTAGRKAEIAENILLDNRFERAISTQVVSEFIRIARSKGRLEWPEIRAHLRMLRAACSVEIVRNEEQDDALDLAERYGFSWFDSLIVASALAAGADTLLSEDYQHGMRVDKLRIANPFA